MVTAVNYGMPIYIISTLWLHCLVCHSSKLSIQQIIIKLNNDNIPLCLVGQEIDSSGHVPYWSPVHFQQSTIKHISSCNS